MPVSVSPGFQPQIVGGNDQLRPFARAATLPSSRPSRDQAFAVRTHFSRLPGAAPHRFRPLPTPNVIELRHIERLDPNPGFERRRRAARRSAAA